MPKTFRWLWLYCSILRKFSSIHLFQSKKCWHYYNNHSQRSFMDQNMCRLTRHCSASDVHRNTRLTDWSLLITAHYATKSTTRYSWFMFPLMSDDSDVEKWSHVCRGAIRERDKSGRGTERNLVQVFWASLAYRPEVRSRVTAEVLLSVSPPTPLP